jgi:translation initiation factor IF-2-like protein
MEETIRVYALARHLGVDTKLVLAACQQAGIGAKNSVSSLDASQRAIIERLIGRNRRDDLDGGATAPVPVWRPPPHGHHGLSF